MLYSQALSGPQSRRVKVYLPRHFRVMFKFHVLCPPGCQDPGTPRRRDFYPASFQFDDWMFEFLDHDSAGPGPEVRRSHWHPSLPAPRLGPSRPGGSPRRQATIATGSGPDSLMRQAGHTPPASGRWPPGPLSELPIMSHSVSGRLVWRPRPWPRPRRLSHLVGWPGVRRRARRITTSD